MKTQDRPLVASMAASSQAKHEGGSRRRKGGRCKGLVGLQMLHAQDSPVTTPTKAREASARKQAAAQIPHHDVSPTLENRGFTWRQCMFNMWRQSAETPVVDAAQLMPSPFRGSGAAVSTLCCQPGVQDAAASIKAMHGAIPPLSELCLMAAAPSIHWKASGAEVLQAGMPAATLNLVMRWGAASQPNAPLPHPIVSAAIVEGSCTVLALGGHTCTSRALLSVASAVSAATPPTSPAATGGWEDAIEEEKVPEPLQPTLHELYCTWAYEPLVKGGLAALLRTPACAALHIVDLTGTQLPPRRAPVILDALGTCHDIRLLSLAATGLCSVGPLLGQALGATRLPLLRVLDLRLLPIDSAYAGTPGGATEELGLAKDFSLESTLILLQSTPPQPTKLNTVGDG